MTGTRIIITAFCLLIVGLMAFYGLRSCTKQPKPVTPARSEQQKQALQTDDKVDMAVYAADTLRRFNENKALRERLILANDKVADLKEKARQSAANNARTPSLPNCTHALNACQEHAAALEDVVGIQDVQLNGYEESQRADRNEIARINSVKDSAFAGWGLANEGWQKTEHALVKEKNGRFRLYGAVQAGTDGKAVKSVTPTAVLTTPKGWLLMGGYDVIQGQYTAGGGIEIRFGR